MAEKLLIGPVRVGFRALSEPKIVKGGKDGDNATPSYNIELLISKKNQKDIIKSIKDNYHKIIDDKGDWTKEKKKFVKDYCDNDVKYAVMKDGDKKNEMRAMNNKYEYPEYSEHMIMNVKRPGSGKWTPPSVYVTENGERVKVATVENDDIIRSGFWVYVSVEPRLYNAQGSDGISYTLHGVMLYKKDEEFVHDTTSGDFNGVTVPDSNSSDDDTPFN